MDSYRFTTREKIFLIITPILVILFFIGVFFGGKYLISNVDQAGIVEQYNESVKEHQVEEFEILTIRVMNEKNFLREKNKIEYTYNRNGSINKKRIKIESVQIGDKTCVIDYLFFSKLVLSLEDYMELTGASIWEP